MKIMSVQTPIAWAITKKWGVPTYLGESLLGYNKFGEDGTGTIGGINLSEINDGIYRQQKCNEGKITVRMKFYRPTNPQTATQQANRTKLGEATAGYKALSEAEKWEYRKRSAGKRMNGLNLFVREYMLS